MAEDKKTIEYFNPDYQYRAVKALIEDKTLLGDIMGVIDQNAFADAGLRNILCYIKDYYTDNGYIPDYDVITLHFQTKANKSTVETLRALGMVKGASVANMRDIKNEMLKFFQLKYIVKAANQIIQKAEYADAVELIESARKSLDEIAGLNNGSDCTIVRITEDTVLDALTRPMEERIGTYIKEIDINIGGGLTKGEIGEFIAPTGFGKTTFGSILASNLAIHGRKVFQLVFEDERNNLVRKQVAQIANISAGKLRGLNLDEANVLTKTVANSPSFPAVKNNLCLAKMPNGDTTVEMVDSELTKLANKEGFVPDVVIIDYLKCFKYKHQNGGGEGAAELAATVRKIQNLIADKHNCVVWLMHQTNVGGVKSDDQTGGLASVMGSYEITNPAAVVLTLKRTPEQKQQNRADILFSKCRHFSPDHHLTDIVFDGGRLVIDCSETVRNDDPTKIFDNQYLNNLTNNIPSNDAF